MNARYYLLRNNQESGPFSLDELLQQCLLPGDLLWVEGRSQNWQEPFDIAEVKAALPKGYSLTPLPPEAAEGTLSERELARRAEQLRRRALATLYQQPPQLQQGHPRAEAPVGGGAYLREEESIEVVHHTPRRGGIVAEVLFFGTVATLAVLGWRGGFFAQLIQVRPETSTVATKLETERAHAAAAPLLTPAAPKNVVQPLERTDSLRVDSTMVTDSLAPAMAANAIPALTRKPLNAPKPVITATEADSLAQGEPTRAAARAASNIKAEPEQRTLASNTATATQKEVPAPSENPAPSAAKAEEGAAPEKKTFGQVLRGIFKKKKKQEVDTTRTTGGAAASN